MVQEVFAKAPLAIWNPTDANQSATSIESNFRSARWTCLNFNGILKAMC
jgi:hypothetical protein